MPLTMCPLSNLELQVTPTSRSTRSSGCSTPAWSSPSTRTTPPTSAATCCENYDAVQQALGLSHADMAQLARNSITASWLPPERKAELVAEIDRGGRRAPRPQAVTPPSTTSVRPVTKLASSLARKATAAASSSGRPIRPSGYPSSWTLK